MIKLSKCKDCAACADCSNAAKKNMKPGHEVECTDWKPLTFEDVKAGWPHPKFLHVGIGL